MMFFWFGAWKWIMVIHLAAALLPALFLLVYIYRQDRVEKEPIGLLAVLFLLGMVAALCAGALESILGPVLGILVREGTILHTVLLAFVVVAMVEEGAKFFVLKRRTWKHPAFNYRFDAIVYAAAVSMGFAAYENVLYVFSHGLSTAAMRAVTAIPAHLSFAVFCGVFYGRAKRCSLYGKEKMAHWNLQMAYVIAVVFHGFYDACAMVGTRAAELIFLGFVTAMFLVVFWIIKNESRTDQYM